MQSDPLSESRLPSDASSIAALQRSGPGTRCALLQACVADADLPTARAVFTTRFDAEALVVARAADAAAARGERLGALAGLPVTVKDLFDIAGRTTLAGSTLRRGAPAAATDAAVVTRLRAAGAAITGSTNMSEFAFSGVGLNPHHGTPANPCDTAVVRIPGGSSSGAAVSVALGLAVGALGSDTGGSIRIPAALCGLVGFKNTQARTPLDGAFPLSPTLDTTCAMARSVADVLVLDAVLAGAPLVVPERAAAGLRLALPQTLMLSGLDATVAAAWQRALTRLSAAGATLVELPLAELAELADINAAGAITPAEAFALHRAEMRTRRAEFDPRVAQRIALGEKIGAADYIVLLQRRRDWAARVAARLRGFDALIAPTVPIVAPPMAPLEADDKLFFDTNALLLRNPSAINFLDGCSFSLPMHLPGELPSGLMLAAPAGHDAVLAGVALAVEAVLRAR